MPKPVILIVEDEPLILMSAMDMAEDAGFEVVGVGSSAAAIVILEQRSDIRIVFTDVDLPHGEDGIWLAAQVADRWPPVAIIVTSGHRHVTQALLPEGATFFGKPYREDEIVGAFHRLAA